MEKCFGISQSVGKGLWRVGGHRVYVDCRMSVYRPSRRETNNLFSFLSYRSRELRWHPRDRQTKRDGRERNTGQWSSLGPYVLFRIFSGWTQDGSRGRVTGRRTDRRDRETRGEMVSRKRTTVRGTVHTDPFGITRVWGQSGRRVVDSVWEINIKGSWYK